MKQKRKKKCTSTAKISSNKKMGLPRLLKIVETLQEKVPKG